ncbi:MAG: proteasome subunit beta [archaeon]|nr:proteasome subunit beta [Nanoarchaeota archaeon]
MEEMLKTGTTTIGIVCKDGVILAADTRATAGNMIVDKRAEKVHIINDDIAVTIAGSVSEAQLLIKLIRAELKLKEVRTNKIPTIKESANLLGSLLYASLRRMSMFPAIAHFLMAGKDATGLHLYDLFPDGSVTRMRDYVSSGSGSVFAYGVLESQYNPEMTTKEGIKLAITAVNAALQRDSASGNGIEIVVVSKNSIESVLKRELNYSLEK